MKQNPAFFTYDPTHGDAYYFSPTNRTPPPYLAQRKVTAILDIASDGTLAGVELVIGNLPPPPPNTNNTDLELKIEKTTIITIDLTGQENETNRIYDAIETLLHNMGQIGTLSFCSK